MKNHGYKENLCKTCEKKDGTEELKCTECLGGNTRDADDKCKCKLKYIDRNGSEGECDYVGAGNIRIVPVGVTTGGKWGSNGSLQVGNNKNTTEVCKIARKINAGG